MATLTVSASHDYSGDALPQTDAILFTAAAVAIFGGSQFAAGMISPDVAMTGDAAPNGLVVNASGSFTMAGWTFSTWDAADTITVNGSSGADTIDGSSQADTIFGGAGSDTLNGGDGNDTLVGGDDVFAQESDTLLGGGGDDTILGEFTDTIDGGAGTDFLYAVNSYDWTISLGATSIEWMLAGFGNDTTMPRRRRQASPSTPAAATTR